MATSESPENCGQHAHTYSLHWWRFSKPLSGSGPSDPQEKLPKSSKILIYRNLPQNICFQRDKKKTFYYTVVIKYFQKRENLTKTFAKLTINQGAHLAPHDQDHKQWEGMCQKSYQNKHVYLPPSRGHSPSTSIPQYPRASKGGPCAEGHVHMNILEGPPCAPPLQVS